MVVYAVVQAILSAWLACCDCDHMEIKMTLTSNRIEAEFALVSFNRRSEPPSRETVVPG